MNINTEHFFGIFLIIIIIIGTLTIYSTQQVVNKYHYSNILNVDSKRLFDLLADVQNYPKMFPENIKSVKILNQTQNIIYTEETISYQGITRVFAVKHEIHQYTSHTITILSGELKNTFFIINFIEKDSKTLFNIEAEVWFPVYLEYFVNTSPSGLNSFTQLINRHVLPNLLN